MNVSFAAVNGIRASASYVQLSLRSSLITSHQLHDEAAFIVLLAAEHSMAATAQAHRTATWRVFLDLTVQPVSSVI
jgi:hypothetical protein